MYKSVKIILSTNYSFVNPFHVAYIITVVTLGGAYNGGGNI